ncbi:hypothetical protein SAMN04487943_108161 [Gracilibacillus orientalis]|uniref:Uncharacterized protein n=1 Tax=Gracilibacillus orientalis TaxID=334253 RepID=A0A1I4NES3_9BACI|nr:hypothetical protein SAMN04487943_108161 [Gracilibacillus orientalis]
MDPTNVIGKELHRCENKKEKLISSYALKEVILSVTCCCLFPLLRKTEIYESFLTEDQVS